MYCDDGRVCVCLCVCLSLAAFLHYCMDPDVTLGNGKRCPPSCALLDEFAIGARFSLLWQHTRLILVFAARLIFIVILCFNNLLYLAVQVFAANISYSAVGS